MAILIIAPEHDAHALAVSEEIAQLGGRSEIVDSGHFPDRARLTMRYECCTGAHGFRLDLEDRSLDLDDFGSVWWRRPNHPQVTGQMGVESHRLFAANEAQEAMNGLWHSMDAEWINEPGRDAVAQRKAYQLRVAQDVGLTIPPTLMTNDPDEVRKFVDSRGYRNVIYKSFSSTQEEWRETRILKQEELGLLDQVRHAPVIFQGYVEAEYDLRITVIDGEIFAAAIYSQETAYKVDCRVDIGKARMAAVELPVELEERLRGLMGRLGLVYGAIDMRLRPDGRYVFFEVNPAGQFLYAEMATGLPIVKAMAKALVARDR